MADFEKFMRSENYKQSYIFRVVKFIKMVGQYSKNLGFATSNNFDSIKSKDKKAFKTYLNDEELQAIEEAVMPTESLENARDWLIISCHLGQRVSDLMRCSKKRIVTNGNRMSVDLRQKKTDKAVMVGIFDKVKEYLAKRDGEFPRPISDQKYNDYIKEVCKIAGLTQIEEGTLYDATFKRGIDGFYEKWQLVTSHAGRRSFATNYYGKVPIALLLVQTGHTTERAFLDYIGKGSLDQTWELLDYMERLKNRN
jgi:integrase